MNISKVKNCTYVGNFQKVDNRLKFEYNKDVSSDILKDSAGRVYFLVVNGIIKKIGGSQSKGGIKSTIGPYISASTGGNPSLRSFGINLLIQEEIDKGNDVKLYMILSTKIIANVPSLFGSSMIDVSPFKEMERSCLSDYRSVEGKYPDWNFQENNETWYERIREKYDYVKNSKK